MYTWILNMDKKEMSNGYNTNSMFGHTKIKNAAEGTVDYMSC